MTASWTSCIYAFPYNASYSVSRNGRHKRHRITLLLQIPQRSRLANGVLSLHHLLICVKDHGAHNVFASYAVGGPLALPRNVRAGSCRSDVEHGEDLERHARS